MVRVRAKSDKRAGRDGGETPRLPGVAGVDTLSAPTPTEETVPMIEKIFKAYDVRATYPNPLNEEAAWKVGHATGQYLLRSRQNLPAEQRVKMENTVCV